MRSRLRRKASVAFTAIVAAFLLSGAVAIAAKYDIAPEPVANLSDAAADEASVLAAALKYLGKSIRVPGVHDSLVGATKFQYSDSLADIRAYWLRDYRDLPAPSAELLEAFRIANLTSIETSARLRLRGRYIAREAWLAQAQRIGWTLALLGTGRSDEYLGGTLRLSRAGIDPNGGRALVGVTLECEGLCGFGALLVLSQENGLWRVEGDLLLWIS